MRHGEELIFIASSGYWIVLALASQSGGYCLSTNDRNYHNIIQEEMGDNLYSHDYAEARRLAMEWGAKHPLRCYNSKEAALKGGIHAKP